MQIVAVVSVLYIMVINIGVYEAKSQVWHIFLTDSNFLTFTVYPTSVAKS